MTDVKESGAYENYLDQDSRLNDEYRMSLEHLVGVIDTPLADNTKAKKSNDPDLWKEIYVHFRNTNDIVDFCKRLGQVIGFKTKEAWYPVVDNRAALFDSTQEPLDYVDPKLVAPVATGSTGALDLDIDDVNAKWREHWVNMPEYIQEDNPTHRTITMKFRSKEDYDDFAKRIDQKITDKSKAIWHPALSVVANRYMRWVQDERTDPKYPVYIISKGRADTMFTSRSLARMRIKHYIAIEPQDQASYEQALINFNIKDYVTLLIAPFSNHGDGPGRARNWCWDHSISIGAKAHWVLDDNISDFYRLHENKRIRVESGVFFAAMEDFFDRYDNLYIAGPQYRFFIAPDQKYPPYVANTRIYSCLLIRNDCKHRWRGRYNEDTDICLRVLKDGDCTVQFNAFMQGKAATQTVKGGNTAEFYHKEFVEDPEEVKLGQYHAAGTINKSQMLADMHPDVARVVWRYGRWHHFVDYTPFKKNKLRLKNGVVLENGTNNYDMRLITLPDTAAVGLDDVI